MRFTLRPYQKECIEAVHDAWKRDVQRPAAVLCTGAGKTVIFSEIASRAVREEGRRPLILVHREELADQTLEKLRQTDPGLTVGIVKAGRHEIDRDIVVASVQTLSRRLGVGRKAVAFDRFSDIITDEAHHGLAPSYQNIYRHFGGLDDATDTRMLGVSATLSRSDGKGLGSLWSEVVYEYSTVRAMEEKYLVPAHAERIILKDLDLSKIKSIGGDYSVEQLGSKMFQSGAQIAQVILDKGRKHDGTLRRFISFAPTVLCAQMWAEEFTAAGIRVKVITGDTPTDVRKWAYAAVNSGEISGMINCMVLTEGFDLPSVELIHVGRPTKSIELYTQIVGRGLRRSDDTAKRDCLILDTVGTVMGKLKTLIDLGLPPACDCACGCELEHLCAMSCNCPRDRRGKLKKPCVVCYRVWKGQPREERERCPHYLAKHVVGCSHRCEGLGRPGTHDPDEVLVILDPEEPDPEDILIDDNGIELTRVELFEREERKAGRRVAPKPKPKPTSWQLTHGGIPFMGPSQNFEFTIFLYQEADGNWTVGEMPMKGGGSPKRIASGLSFTEAKREAQDSHPSGGRRGRPLVGIASEAQLNFMQRLGLEIPPNCTKDQAATAITLRLVSKKLDG